MSTEDLHHFPGLDLLAHSPPDDRLPGAPVPLGSWRALRDGACSRGVWSVGASLQVWRGSPCGSHSRPATSTRSGPRPSYRQEPVMTLSPTAGADAPRTTPAP